LSDSTEWEYFVGLLLKYDRNISKMSTPLMKASGIGGFKTIDQTAIDEMTGIQKSIRSIPVLNKSANQFVNKHYLTEDFKDDVFDVLVKNKNQQKSFDLVWASVNKVSPVDKQEYLKKSVYTKVPVYDTTKGAPLKPIKIKTVNIKASVSDELFMNRYTENVRKNMIVLQKRYDAIQGLQKNINFDNLESSLSQLERINATTRTKIVNINAEIRKQNRRLKQAYASDKPKIEKIIQNLTNDVKKLNTSEYVLSQKINQFTYKNFPNNAKLKSEFSKLCTTMKRDLKGVQSQVVADTALRKAKNQITGTAQTEMIRAKSKADYKKAMSLHRQGKEVVVSIVLNPAHDIVDTCDDRHGTWTLKRFNDLGLYLPPYHKNCGCGFIFYERGSSNELRRF